MAETGTQTIIVQSGANHQPLAPEFIGMTIGDVREQLGDAMNINANALCRVDGQKVSDDYVIVATDEVIEFVQAAGEKAAA